jgi:hypothetical protein
MVKLVIVGSGLVENGAKFGNCWKGAMVGKKGKMLEAIM